MKNQILIFKNDQNLLCRVFSAHGNRPHEDTLLLEEIKKLGGCECYDEDAPLLIVVGKSVKVDDVLDVVRDSGYDVDIVLSSES